MLNMLNKKHKQSGKLTFLYTNCDYGLENKLAELEIKMLANQPDIITEVIPENTQHSEEREPIIPMYQLRNYTMYHNINKPDGRGICMYVKSLSLSEVSNQNMDEDLWAEIKLNNKTVKVGCIYRSPSGNSEESMQLRNHIKEMSNWK